MSYIGLQLVWKISFNEGFFFFFIYKYIKIQFIYLKAKSYARAYFFSFYFLGDNKIFIIIIVKHVCIQKIISYYVIILVWVSLSNLI
jgi:hypothetical protein